MKISTNIIKEKMSGLLDEELLAFSTPGEIRHCCFFMGNTSELSDSILYLVERHDLCAFEQNTGTYPYICYNKEQTNASHLLDYVNGILDWFNAWQYRIFRATMQGSQLQEIINICAEPFVNPIAFFDAYSVLLAYAGEFENPPDKVWQLVIKEGYFPLERYTSSDINLKELLQAQAATVVRAPTADANMTAICLFYECNMSAIICATDINQPFSKGQLDLFILLKRILEETNILNEYVLKENRNSGFVIDRMLRGTPTETSVIQHYLKKWNHHMDDNFSLRYISSPSNLLSNEDKIGLIHRLGRTIPDSVICSFEEGIAILMGRDLSVDEHNTIHQVLLRYKVHCYVSSTFSPFTYLRYAYLQCRYLIAISEEKEQLEIYFDEAYEELILHSLSKVVSVKAICDSRILKISQERNGKIFIESLKSYLMNGRSITATANKLFLHRNTLIYRIEKMKQLLQMDFDKMSDNELFHLLLSCKIATEL